MIQGFQMIINNSVLVKFFLLFVFCLFAYGKCPTEDVCNSIICITEEIDNQIALTNSNIAHERTSADIGKRIIDSLSIRKQSLITLFNQLEICNGGKNAISNKDKVFKKREIESYIKLVISTMRSLETMKRLYNVDKLKKFSGAKFFKPGQYKIPPDHTLPILNDLNPLISEIQYQIENDSNTQIKIVIGVYGYSDEQNVIPGSSLYNDLLHRINTDNNKYMYAGQSLNNQLNYKLSQLRSEALKEIIDSELKRRENESNKNLLFEVNWLGMGTALPKGIINPQKDDERRRIVRIYWDILPYFQNNEQLVEDFKNKEQLASDFFEKCKAKKRK